MQQTCARGTPHFSLHFVTCAREASHYFTFFCCEIHIYFTGISHLFTGISHFVYRNFTFCCQQICIFCWSDFAGLARKLFWGMTRLAPLAGQAWPGVRWPGRCRAAPGRGGPQSNPLGPISASSSTAPPRPT